MIGVIWWSCFNGQVIFSVGIQRQLIDDISYYIVTTVYKLLVYLQFIACLSKYLVPSFATQSSPWTLLRSAAFKIIIVATSTHEIIDSTWYSICWFLIISRSWRLLYYYIGDAAMFILYCYVWPGWMLRCSWWIARQFLSFRYCYLWLNWTSVFMLVISPVLHSCLMGAFFVRKRTDASRIANRFINQIRIAQIPLALSLSLSLNIGPLFVVGRIIFKTRIRRHSIPKLSWTTFCWVWFYFCFLIILFLPIIDHTPHLLLIDNFLFRFFFHSW